MENNAYWLRNLPRSQLDLWENQKQFDFFGQEANSIWEGKRFYSEFRSDLEKIADSRERDLNRQADLYLEALSQHTQEGTPRNARHTFQKADWMDLFFSISTVQKNLHSLSDDEREQALQQIRKRFGLTDDAVSRLSRLDEQRALRWKKGQVYMTVRQELISDCDPASKDALLDDLRHEYFGDIALTIKQEEAAGFFRFNEQRRYGIN